MTNYEWIKSLSVEEMAKCIINPCENLRCSKCPYEWRCRTTDGNANNLSISWLNEEREV